MNAIPSDGQISTVESDLDGFFQGLGASFLGKLANDSLRKDMSMGWRVALKGRELLVQIDERFPFSKPCVCLSTNGLSVPQPHVEPDGKLCLGADQLPLDAVVSIRIVLGEAMRLLSENENGIHADDFLEDFSLYWLNWAPAQTVRALVLPCRDLNGTHFTTSVRTARDVYIFPRMVDAIEFWEARTGDRPRKPKRAISIGINPLPTPSRYPNTTSELWSLIEARSNAGTDRLKELISSHPYEAFVVLAGRAPSGREHHVVVRLFIPDCGRGKPAKNRKQRRELSSVISDDDFLKQYEMERLRTKRLDAASSRLPDGLERELTKSRVVVVGCGSLGSGVARLLAQSGVGHLHLVDPELMDWENIRRHELGSRQVGAPKALALATRIRNSVPLNGTVVDYWMAFHEFASKHADILAHADVVLSCVGEWLVDASVDSLMRSRGNAGAVVYGWMEANALAAHAVMIGPEGPSFADGFDDHGNFRMPAVIVGKTPPPECGASTSPYGALELSAAQTLVTRLVIDALRKKVTAPTWRTWLADANAVKDAEAEWSGGWIAARGQPTELGGIVLGNWNFS